MLNLLHLVSNKVWGGGERYALDLCRHAETDGVNVAVITRCKEAVDAPFRDAGFTPGHLPLGGALDFVSPLLLAKVLRRIETPAVIHVHNFKDAATAVRARKLSGRNGIRVVVTRHLVKPARTGPAAEALYNSLDAVIFVSDAARNAFMASNPRVNPEKLTVVHNAVEMPEVTAVNKKGDELRVVYAGRLSPEKGVDKLIEAFASMPANARLHIAGSGTTQYEHSLMQRAHAVGRGNDVVWYGHLDDPLAVMASADIGVLPTQVPEAFGLTALEFMHLGVPVVSNCKGGPAEMISDGVDGLLTDCTDIAALRSALLALASDSCLRCSMGKKAAETARTRFAYDDFYKRIKSIYEGH